MTFERKLGDVPGLPTSPVVRPAREEDLQQLRALASKGHRDTRFYFDRHFDHTKCDLLYETWIEKSFRGFEQGMLVVEVKDCRLRHRASPRHGSPDWNHRGS